MAINQQFISLDSLYQSSTGDKIILNDLSYLDMNDIKSINESLLTVYGGEVISTIPSCDCPTGGLVGRYLLGTVCDKCGVEVAEARDKLDPVIWLRSLSSTGLFISPHFWLMLRKAISKNLDVLRWLSDTSYNPPVTLPPYLDNLKNLIGGRYYSNMSNNLEKIMSFLLEQPSFKVASKAVNLEGILELYKKNKKLIHSNYLPIVNKKLFVMEDTSSGKYTNLVIGDVVDLVLSFVRVSTPNTSPRRTSNAVGSVISKLANMYNDYYSDFITGKGGSFRKHLYGSRSNFSFRALIVPKTGRHKYNEIDVPWSIGVTVFRPHIMNKLLYKYKMKFREATALMFESVHKYSDLINDILNELLREAPDGKLWVILQRNPSLFSGSAQKVYIGSFKTDPKDKSMAMSVLIVKAPNGDFDGDAEVTK